MILNYVPLAKPTAKRESIYRINADGEMTERIRMLGKDGIYRGATPENLQTMDFRFGKL